MTGFTFRKNMVFEWKGVPFRMERLLADDELIVEQTQTGSITRLTRAELLDAYQNGHIKVAPVTPQSHSYPATYGRPLQDLPQAVQAETSRRWQYVTQVLECGKPTFTAHYLTPMLEDIASKLRDPKPPSLATFYRWYRNYLRSGEPRSLVPRHDLRGSTRSKQAEDVQRIFSEALDKAFTLSPTPTIASIHALLSERVWFENARRLPDNQLRVPHKRTVYRMVSKMDAYDLTVRREGRVAADRRLKLVGSGPRSSEILERVEVDHTPLDLFLVDERTWLPIGRPLLTMFLDHYSRMPLGYYLSYGSASAAAVMGALRHAVMPKTPAAQLIATLRTEHAWPCYGLPETLVLDNGLEFLGGTLESVALDLEIRLQFCPKRQPRFKGSIERYLKTINYHFAHQMPGTSFARLQQRGDYNPEKHAVLTLGEFVQIFEKWLLDVYAQRPHRGLDGVSPWARWKEGTLRSEPMLPASLDVLRRRIGLVCDRSLRRDGITLNSIRYNSEGLQPVINAFGVGTKVRVLHDPSDLGEIFVWGPESREPVIVPALDQAYAKGLSAMQHELIMEVQRERGELGSNLVGALEAQGHIANEVERLMQSRKPRQRRKGATLRGDDSLKQQGKPASSVRQIPPPAGPANPTSTKNSQLTRPAYGPNSRLDDFKLPPILPSFQLKRNLQGHSSSDKRRSR